MYVGGNVVVSAAGNLEHNAIVRLVERAQRRPADTPPKGVRVRRPLVAPPPPTLRFQQKDTEQYHVCVGAPGISRSDRRRFAASLLDSILGGSASSRLFQEIREKRGMAYAVYSFTSQYTDTGPDRLLRRHARGEPRRVPRDRRARARRTSRPGNLRPNELARAKENLKGRIVLSMESTSNRMSRLGKSLITDTELLSLDRLIAEIDAVDEDAVTELAAVLLEPSQLSASGIGPDEDVFSSAVANVNPALVRRAAA